MGIMALWRSWKFLFFRLDVLIAVFALINCGRVLVANEVVAQSSIGCLSDEPCLNGGQCVRRQTIGGDASSNGSYICLCANGYSGQRCEMRNSRRPCVVNICSNGGTCFIEANRHRCVCPSGFGGQKCEGVDSGPKVSGCANGTCPFDSLCLEGRCQCRNGYIGSPGKCRRPVSPNITDPCLQDPCRNGGTCNRNLTKGATKSVWCTCPKGFTGDFCELRRIRSTDICANVVCGPGQRCTSGSGGIHRCVSVIPILHSPPLLADDATQASMIISQAEATSVASFPTAPPFPSPRDNNLSMATCDDGTGTKANRLCSNNGRCLPNNQGGFSCLCTPGWTGIFCETAIVNCGSSPCFNNGSCVEDSNKKMVCKCMAGFTGPHCETNLDDCKGIQCLNGGKCIDLVSDYSCQCPVSYSGKNCEKIRDACDAALCQNGANCTTRTNANGQEFFCQCRPGFTGHHCETNVDDCAGVQCPNGKVCIDGIKTYECRCPPRFFGADCEFEAASSNECGTCKNGATCLRRRIEGEKQGNFTCVCRPGYTGKDCEREVDECELYNNPCLNGGTCFDGLVGFECRCPPGFTGLRCDSRIGDPCLANPCPKDSVCTASAHDPKGYVCLGTTQTATTIACTDKPCQNDGMCVSDTGNDTVSFKCICLPGFSGVYCQWSVQEFDIGMEEGLPLKNVNCDDGTPNPCQNGGTCRNGPSKTCICPPGFSGSYCEDDVDECEDDPCGKNGGRFVCINTIGSYRCDCTSLWTGGQCETELIGCRSNQCSKQNTMCKPTFLNGEHGHKCDCAPGYYGSECSEDSTVSFNGNSLIYHLNTGAAVGSSSPSNYSNSFRFRTSLSNVVVVEGVDITPSIVFAIHIRDGRLQLDWTKGDREKRFKSIAFRARIDNGDWYGVDLKEEKMSVQMNLFNSNGSLVEAVTLAKSAKSDGILPVFTTKFGGLASTGGKSYLAGCMQDMFINGQRLTLAEGEKSHTAVNVVKGCLRKVQCQQSESKDVCGGPSRGQCIDMWTNHSCLCKRPYLEPDCSRALKEATFGYEGNLSYVEVILDQADKKSVEMAIDISMMIRTRASDGLLAYLGSNLNYDNPNNAYQSFITLEMAGGRLKSLVQLGTAKPQMYLDEGTNIKGSKLKRKPIGDRRRNSKSMHDQLEPEGVESIVATTESTLNPDSDHSKKRYRRLDDGKVHLVRLIRRENEIKGYVDDVEVFEGRLNSPFPYPLLIDHVYLGGMPSGGVAVVTRQKRGIDDIVRPRRQMDTHQIARQSFKGTMQDVRVNEEHVPLLKKHLQELIPSTANGRILGDPMPHNNVLEGTISDDVCRWKPCQNSGVCKVTFNDYECTCSAGWWGKNCTLEDVCYQRKPCQDPFKCHNLQKSAMENGYVCTQAVTLNGSSSAVFSVLKAEEEEENEEGDQTMDTIQFDLRTRSTSGVILMVVNERDTKVDTSRDLATTAASILIGEITTDGQDILPELVGNLTDLETLTTPGHSKLMRHRARDQVRRPRDTSIFHPNEYLVLEIKDGGLDLSFIIKRMNLNVHLKNISGDLVITDGEWHSISIEFDLEAITVEVDDEKRRLGQESGGGMWPLKALMDGNPVVRVGSMPKQLSTLADNGGQSFKGCLRDARLGKDGWLLFQQQTTPLQQLVSASKIGRIFVVNSTNSIRDDGCHGDDVCHIGKKDTCQNGATCDDEWNRFKCHCPFGFKGDMCEINIDDCVDHQCTNGATCVDGIGNYTCSCVYGYTGQFCETNIDECLSSPCQNNGTCADLIGGFECHCNANFTGAQCEIWILVDCASNPCQNGGKCADTQLPSGHKTFNCTCSLAFYGRACEKEKNFCENSPCLNGGNCSSHSELLDYRCSCPNGFTGRNCEENVNECLQNPCLHGQCIDGWGNFSCECLAGWTGLMCDEDIDECAHSPCSTGKRICVNAMGSYHCQCPQFYFGENCEIEGACLKQPCVRGNCSQLSSTTPHHCECPYGFTGLACETEINFCESNPCQNGATCQPFTGGFHCACIFGFTGTLCETNINECEPKPCENSGICIDGIGEYTCNCTGTGYNGLTCHDDVDECQIPSMCVHTIGCTNLIGSYNCSCQTDYMGPKCDIRNPCLSNVTHSCQNNGRCVNPGVLVDKAGGGVAKVMYECDCSDGFYGEYCQMMRKSEMAGLGGRLEYILGPVAGALVVILIVAAVLFVLMLRNKRATHGTYSPSRQEISGARMQMGPMIKPPPEERLI